MFYYQICNTSTKIFITDFGIYLWLDVFIKRLYTSTPLSTLRHLHCPILTCIPSHAYHFGHYTGSRRVFSQLESGSSDTSVVISLFQSQRLSTILLDGSSTLRKLLPETLSWKCWHFFLGSAYLIMLGALRTRNIMHRLAIWRRTKSSSPLLVHNLACDLSTPRKRTFLVPA